MNIHEVAGKIAGSGEYVLGFDATGSHACYLIYGVMKAGESGRVLKPGAGHEEMILALNGSLVLRGGPAAELKAGQAVHLQGEESLLADNPGTTDVLYVIAGGHAAAGHGH